MLQSEEEMREALRRIDAPLMFNYVENKVPALTVQRFGELGFRVVCYPVSSTLAYAHLMERFASLLKASGTTAGLAKEMLSLRDYEQLLDRPRYA
jgi:2-methylisocitrate lyase-like PEP mutase family enzyme